jgi:hypothetical protein
MPGKFSDYPALVVRNTGTDRELTMMRRGMPPSPKIGGPAGHQYPQHGFAALQQLRRIRIGTRPGASENRYLRMV